MSHAPVRGSWYSMDMERDLNDFGFDMNVIYVDRHRWNEETQVRSAEDRRVIDLERYRIMKTMRTVMNVR
jgi:hypothetical protein